MAINPNRSNLDATQIFQRVMDEPNDRLRVDANVTATVGDMEVAISHVDDSIRLGDGTTLFTSTTVGPKTGLDVSIISGSITGEFTQTGLKTQGKLTTMDVTSSATALPATPLTNRNSLSIANLSTTDTLYIGFSTGITADRTLGNNAGWEIGPNEGFNLDVQDDILIYGITETGKTVRIKIMELA